MVGHPANRTNFWLLDAHDIERLLGRRRIVNILVDSSLSTEVSIIVIQRIQYLAEGFVQAGVGLVHAVALGVMRDGLASHLLIVLLHGMVLINHIGQLLPLQVMSDLTCNLPFLNCWLILL